MSILKGSILIVDHSHAVRTALRSALEQLGHFVVEATNGVDAFTTLWERPFDLIFLGIHMPRMNGCEVLQKLRRDENLSHIPVIMLADNKDFEMVMHCIELGALDYLSKPFNPILLKARVNACLEKKYLLDQEILQQKAIDGLYETIKQTDAAKEGFVAMVAHELRNPLMGLFASYELLKRLDPTEQQATILRSMHYSLNNLKVIVGDLNDISRIENDHIHLELSEVSLRQIVEHVITSLKFKADQRNHQFVLDLPKDWVVFGDRFRVTQILTNLLSNAIKYTPENGRISITARPYHLDVSQLHITIEDNGIGMSHKTANHIFDKYYRAGNEETIQEEGIGLGMFITKTLIDKHGGLVWVKSARHHGTAVHFTLPLVNQSGWSIYPNNDTFSCEIVTRTIQERINVPIHQT